MTSFFKRLIGLLGVSRLRAKYLKPGLYCFNYHRIGNPEDTDYDPNVFSCTEETFNTHLEFIKKTFRVVDLSQLENLIQSNEPITEHLALITFDDGYIDNYELAYPLLKKHGLSALFFLPTNFISSQDIPWWDELALLVKKTSQTKIRMNSSLPEIIIDKKNISSSIRALSKQFKLDNKNTVDEKMKSIRLLLGDNLETVSSQKLFLNWEMANEMQQNGMDIGSHSCSHQILSHLSPEQQSKEIQKSKVCLEQKSIFNVVSFAYPVGGSDSYNEFTKSAVEDNGYSVAFTCVKGVNVDLKANRYSIKRFNVNGDCNIDQLVNLIWR